MEVTRLQEDLKLTTGRLNTATGQAADLLQQLKAVQADNASLMGQLAHCQGRDTEAAAAHTALQEALHGMRADLSRQVMHTHSSQRTATCGLHLLPRSAC
jgi:chromosome segregation ATPase